MRPDRGRAARIRPCWQSPLAAGRHTRTHVTTVDSLPRQVAFGRPGHEILERRARFSIKIQDYFKLISDYPSDLPDFELSLAEVVRKGSGAAT